MSRPSIVWFRQDLRVEDQPALHAAISKGGAIIPLFIWAPQELGKWAPGAASRWWLHGSLAYLQRELRALKLTLILRQQPALQALLEIAKQTGADAVFWNQCYEPEAMQRDARIQKALNQAEIKVHISNGSLLFQPSRILNKQNKPYQVFTPFWKACCELGDPLAPFPKPLTAISYTNEIASEKLEQLHLLPKIPWDKGLKQKWQRDNKTAQDQLNCALQQAVDHYAQKRDQLSLDGTAELSPYLHMGEISPRMIWRAVRQKFGYHKESEAFLRQLCWREFAYYLLYHFPHTPTKPLQKDYHFFPWRVDNQALHAWQKGLTGYPVVDAGMRQLWEIGWMHNRARLITGSFLVKDLRMDWQEGAKWFWDTLVDADLANNTLGWQWIAGCGADAAPYFRIFNPVTQGEKFDPMGTYIRQWVPELRALPNEWIHRPWEAPENILQQAGVVIGENYPKPIVEHSQARKEALEKYTEWGRKVRGKPMNFE